MLYACLEVFKEYEKNNTFKSNLTPTEEQGLKEIREGVKKKKWILYACDKSGKQVLDSKDNYLMAMMKHFEKDIPVGMDEIRVSEETLYNHSTVMCRILKMGKEAGDGQADKIVESFKVVFGGVPALVGSRKDHKENWDPVIGPATRPICNAFLGPNSGLGNIMARVLRPLRKRLCENVGTEVCSTEEILRSFYDLNQEPNPNCLSRNLTA